MKEKAILNQLGDTPYGSLLRIMWLDACTVSDAKLSGLPLPNYYVETRRTTIGSYVTVQKGEHQGAPHLVMEIDSTEGSGSKITSIPACLLYKVDAAPIKWPEATERGGFSYRNWKHREKMSIRLRDGSVKMFD